MATRQTGLALLCSALMLSLVVTGLLGGAAGTTGEPEPILAAYSMAFYLHATLGSPVWACQFVAISYIRDRASMRRLLIFSTQTFALVGWFWALIALTPFGPAFFAKVFGASPGSDS